MGMTRSLLNLQFEEVDCKQSHFYKVWTEHKQRPLGEIIFDITAGWVYVLDEDDNSGYLTAEFLYTIARKLDELNTSLFKDFPHA